MTRRVDLLDVWARITAEVLELVIRVATRGRFPVNRG
jgi:hypothetical protein